MTKQTTWTEAFEIKTSETDFQRQWKPSGFFRTMQEIGTHHSIHLGYDYHKMNAQGMAFLLSRVKIHFNRFPGPSEQIVLETWPKGMQQKIFFMRDFQFRSLEGEPIASATSAWLLVDLNARRFLLPNVLKEKLPDNNGRFALDESLEKIGVPDQMEERLVAEAVYSTVDMMGHVNNAQYIDWVTDCFPFETFQEKKLNWMQINYLQEVKPREHVSVAVGPCPEDGAAWVVQGSNLDTSAKAFEAQLGWSG